MNRKMMRPTRQIALSFLVIIIIGSILLTLPITNIKAPTSYLNNLFVATSATCVTGLVPITIVYQYNLLGQVIIILMIQIGGLGFLTFLNLLILKFKKKITLTNKIVIQEAFNHPDLNDLSKFVKNVIKYTLIIEGLGALFLSFVFIPEFGFIKGLYYALFHAISAFCNAGFDVLGSNSLIDYQTNPIINIVIPVLIILGGLGFIVWFDIGRVIKNKGLKKNFFKQLSLHSKIALLVTIFLLISGMILFYLCEFSNHKTIANLSWFDQIQVAWFQSATLRTAGFASVDMTALKTATKFMMCLIMFIGGCPSGTAGGIKTVTWMLGILEVYRIYRGNQEVSIFNRRIPKHLIVRSFAVISLALSLTMASIFALSLLENKPFIDLCFEVVSAIATVGLTAGLTPGLSSLSKLLIIILMFIGRIGPITLVISFARKSYLKSNNKELVYPDGNVLIG